MYTPMAQPKNNVLETLAQLISSQKQAIIEANQQDLAQAQNLDATLYDRLKVDATKVDAMVASVQQVKSQVDDEGKLLSEYLHPNGMLVQNKVVPFGKVLIIYESRPDVTIEAAAIAFKSGNTIFLKGGKEAACTNTFLVQLWHQALIQHGLSTGLINYLEVSRQQMQALLASNELGFDLVIPRGGEQLINYIKQNTNIPLLISGRGNNFIYIHEQATEQMAVDLVLNGKSRLSVCNAIDKVLIDVAWVEKPGFITTLVTALEAINIVPYFYNNDLYQQHKALLPQLNLLEGEDTMHEEYLSAKILLCLVENVQGACNTINQYSGGHSAVIVTNSTETATYFMQQADCAAVYHNASSRFTDGGQLGLGAEMAISTQKLHFRGPVGVSQLLTNKWFIVGNGQVR
jgi:glutamate-5-semialdehyde dehydrogenase